ncbi:MAG: hypothetical protein AB7O70_11445 [Hyphomicrobiales bacterium]
MTRFRAFLFALCAVVSAVALFSPPSGGPASAGEGVTLASMPALPGGLVQTLPRSQAQPVSYCRRDCENCRGYCYNSYRINCYEYWCRKAFSDCMKDCWSNICRQCGY